MKIFCVARSRFSLALLVASLSLLSAVSALAQDPTAVPFVSVSPEELSTSTTNLLAQLGLGGVIVMFIIFAGAAYLFMKSRRAVS